MSVGAQTMTVLAVIVTVSIPADTFKHAQVSLCSIMSFTGIQ